MKGALGRLARGLGRLAREALHLLLRLSHGASARLRDLFFRSAADRATDEELRFHLDMETEKYVQEGMDPAEARRRARVAFGGVERHRERLREGRRVPGLEPLLHDTRFAFRSLARTPGLTLLAAFTIALGVGATTAAFSVVNGLLLRPLPVPDPERLVSIQEARSGAVSTDVDGMRIPYARVVQYRAAASDLFESVASQRLDRFSLRLEDRTVAVPGALTSGNYFETLRVRPALGRAYASDDEAAVVLSHDLWLRAFAGDSAAVGRTVRVDGRPVTVVGVAPEGFRGATLLADEMWVPFGVRGDGCTGLERIMECWDTRSAPFARLRPGVSRERAEAAVDALGRRMEAEANTTVHRVALVPMNGFIASGRGPVTGFLGMLQGMALVVLLIAAANLAGVLLARAVARRREMALRQAIGAGRPRLVRHLLAESLVVFALGGAGGVALAYAATAWLAGLPLPAQVSAVLDLHPDLRVLAFAAGLTGLTGVLFGLVPALRGSRPDLVPALKSGGGGAVAEGGRVRQLFVAGQVALAVLLLLTATLFVRSLRSGLDADPGFDPDGVVAATVDLRDYAPERGRALQRALLERVRAAPGVRAAGLSQFVPLGWTQSRGPASRPDAPDLPYTNVPYASVDPGYFGALGIDVVAGRGFTDADRDGSTPVAVINQRLAERLWGGQNPVGRRLRAIGRELEVVGVARDARYTSVTEEPTGFVYVPFWQVYRSRMAVLVRAPGAEAEALRAVEAALRELDPDVAVQMGVRLTDMIGFGLYPQRFAAQVVGAFGLVGLVLAALGIYGVLAYQVTQRRRELGVRRALGARRADLVRGVVGRGGLLALGGALVGMAAGAAVAIAVRSLLFGIQPLDPLTFALVPASLLVVAVLASAVPALRAGAVPPVEALREE